MVLIPKINAHYGFKNFLKGIKSIFSKQNPSTENDTYYLNHARTGIRIAISSLQLPGGSKVAMSMYNCYTVMNAVKQAGYGIVFIETNDEFKLDIDDLKKKKDDFQALIVTHLYGIPNDLPEIKKNCLDIPIIEDCAHAFLSSSKQYKTGTLGDLAIFSLGLGKFPSIGEGGILTVNNKIYDEKVKVEYGKLRNYTFFEEIKLIINNFITSVVHIPIIYKWISLPLKKKKQKTQNIGTYYKHAEKLISKSSFSQFKNDERNFERYKKIQQKNTERILVNITAKEIHLPFIDVVNNNCFMLPILTEDRDSFSMKLKDCRVEIASHFARSIEWAEEFGYIQGNCPNAENIAKTNLIVPIHYNIKDKEIAKLTIYLKKINN
ncbi:MAG: DegT/DnrJ/EryC1/StrS family aminotransferase [Paludibacteraceae bacterium]